jgi:hypothetical protein
VTDGAIRKWPHHVALPAARMRALMNSEVIFCAAGVLSATPFTFSDSDSVVLERNLPGRTRPQRET